MRSSACIEPDRSTSRVRSRGCRGGFALRTASDNVNVSPSCAAAPSTPNVRPSVGATVSKLK
jgi:hypothetical protein